MHAPPVEIVATPLCKCHSRHSTNEAEIFTYRQ